MSGFTYNRMWVLGKILEIPKVMYNQFGEPTAHLNICCKVITDDSLPYVGNPWDDESLKEEWVLVVCRGDLAEKVEKEFDGGDLVYCAGKLAKVEWVDGRKSFHRDIALNATLAVIAAKGAFRVTKS